MKRTRPDARIRRGSCVFSSLLMAALAVTSLNTHATESPGRQNGTNLFSSSELLQVTLTLPWQAIVTDEFFFQGPYPAGIQWVDGQGQRLELPLEVWRRGNSRQIICRFPPIKLVLDKQTTKGTLFQGQKSLKLVAPCDTQAQSGQYVVLEELAYRIYNHLTDLSFRVRPLSLTLHDSDRGRSDTPVAAFLIEDDSDLAGRNGKKKAKLATVSPEQLDPEAAARLALFEYLVGNTHWSLQPGPGDDKCCDNIELIGEVTGVAGSTYAVPKDFDVSGLVNARYARPQAGLPVTAVTQRLYQGYCVHNGALQGARALFLNRQPEILSLIEAEPRLTPGSRAATLAFLGEFFDVLQDDARFQAEIVANCRD